ncbi:Npun_F0296 family exosortase-dependent surface protein [Duganella qianjiadongensis]|uniref:PEPxxWA-CTERM sorting domain-containing protein n=1 Tax=Duganella qianjiadongensis TaxID=2692176 RepID=A0ABW9VRF2_9BURK|nr:PEPxxWA-CTERM sorting domain-containing protein [Duganella qianjiadongensis]MYM40989.1 PEPxxWA-CTERM sorting domain-containing protein [Duganella qianjiadongensis]
MSLSKTLLAIALTGAALSAQAGVTYSATSGTTSGVSGVTTITFDDGLLPSGFASYDTTHAIIPVGGYPGESAPPPNDSTRYFSVGVSGGQVSSSSVSFAGNGASYFGYYMGSPDNYNVVTLYSGNTMLLQINGTNMAQAASVLADGNQGHGFYMNFFTNGGTTISRVTFSSSANAFETDNHAFAAAVPEPETYAMLLTGLGLVGFASRRRRPSSEECFY